MHLLFILLVFSSVFEIVIDICVAPFCNSLLARGSQPVEMSTGDAAVSRQGVLLFYAEIYNSNRMKISS